MPAGGSQRHIFLVLSQERNGTQRVGGRAKESDGLTVTASLVQGLRDSAGRGVCVCVKSTQSVQRPGLGRCFRGGHRDLALTLDISCLGLLLGSGMGKVREEMSLRDCGLLGIVNAKDLGPDPEGRVESAKDFKQGRTRFTTNVGNCWGHCVEEWLLAGGGTGNRESRAYTGLGEQQVALDRGGFPKILREKNQMPDDWLDVGWRGRSA